MNLGGKLALCFSAGVVGLSLAPGAASASVVLGQTTGTVFGENCAGLYTEVQVSTGTGPSYTVPAGGGVITSFSHQGGPNETGQLKLKVYRATGNPNEYTVVGSAPMTMVANQLTTATAHVPVQAGDLLGYTRAAGSTMRCLFNGEGPSDQVRDAPGNDTADFATTTFGAPGSSYLINISAVLEPDADGDQLGDETEDPDDDNDTVADGPDNCPAVANTDQANLDGDAQGDVCDPDDDNDTVADGPDNCPAVANASQVDSNGNGAGDACDPIAAQPLPGIVPSTTTPPSSTKPKSSKKCKKSKKAGARAAKKCKAKKS